MLMTLQEFEKKSNLPELVGTDINIQWARKQRASLFGYKAMIGSMAYKIASGDKALNSNHFIKKLRKIVEADEFIDTYISALDEFILFN